MPLFAHIEDGVVLNVLLADDLKLAETLIGGTCLPCPDNTSVGWVYNYEKDEFAFPVVEVNE